MVEVVRVANKDEGNLRAHDILKGCVDNDTLLVLSGGTTPDYRKMIVEPGDIVPGAIGIVDERYGGFYHENSNELLLKNQGIVGFCHDHTIKFHRILTGKSLEETAEDYEGRLRNLLKAFNKKVGVMGVGSNFHTAGIFPNSKAAQSNKLVEFESFQDLRHVEDKYPKRITMTFRALEQFDAFVVLVFGEDKREVVKVMLDEKEGDEEKYPAVFYRKSGIKTYLVTDQP